MFACLKNNLHPASHGTSRRLTLLHRTGITYSAESATPRLGGSSGRMADTAQLTGYEPKTDSNTRIDVSSGKNFNIESDFMFAVPEDSDNFPQAVGSQRSVMNLESLSCTWKPVPCDESVESVERNSSKTQVDRDQNSAQRQSLHEYGENKARKSKNYKEFVNEEACQVRKLKTEELSLRQDRDPNSVSGLLKQIRELQEKVNSLTDAKEFRDPDTASCSGVSHVPSQPVVIPKSREVPSRDSGLLECHR